MNDFMFIHRKEIPLRMRMIMAKRRKRREKYQMRRMNLKKVESPLMLFHLFRGQKSPKIGKEVTFYLLNVFSRMWSFPCYLDGGRSNHLMYIKSVMLFLRDSVLSAI